EDHLDYYRDLDHICETFNKWLQGVKPGGVCVVNAGHDHCELQTTAEMIKFEVQDRKVEKTGQKFIVEDEVYDLLIPGEFNAENGAAAIMTAKHIGVSSEVCAQALKIILTMLITLMLSREQLKPSKKRFLSVDCWLCLSRIKDQEQRNCLKSLSAPLMALMNL
ncbi:MAG: hypothetical protein UU36_C0040G0007, partial [Candidatus Uhrbacteria bacterium GW2011_GWE2_41_1153]